MTTENFHPEHEAAPRQPEMSTQERLDAYQRKIDAMSPEQRQQHTAFVERGYELHGAAFTDILLGLETPARYESDEKEASQATTEVAFAHEDVTEIASRAEDLIETATDTTVAERDVVDTPVGRKEIEHATLAPGVKMEVVLSDKGPEAIGIEISDGDESHSVGILHPENNPQVTVDGKPVKPEEVPMVVELIEHVREAAVETSEDDTSEETTDSEPEVEVTEEEAAAVRRERSEHYDGADKVKAARFAYEFVRSYASNPTTKAYLRQARIDLDGIAKRLKSGEAEIGPKQIAQMKKLTNEAHFRGSPVWNTEPGDRSQLQRAANEKRQQLVDILRTL